MSKPRSDRDQVELDGSRGEGGGQILRTALTLSLLTGRPFHITRIRANRSKPGLRPQHLTAVEIAGALADAKVVGANVGACDLSFAPKSYVARDINVDIGTAGSTGLVLQTLHLPLAIPATERIKIKLRGGTFNPMAPPFSFLETTWRSYLAAFGMPLELEMQRAGFYPKGGGKITVQIDPSKPARFEQTTRAPVAKIRGTAGVSNLPDRIAVRMKDRAVSRLVEAGLECEIDLVHWPSPGQGAAISLVAEHAGSVPATFVGLGERGKLAEAVADEAVDHLLAFEAVENAAVDPYSADQIILPLVFAAGRSEFTVSEVTEHLRTNVHTIQAFLNRSITIEEASGNEPARVVIA